MYNFITSRYKTILICCFVVITYVILFKFNGYDRTMKFLNIPIMYPHFADLRVITSGLETVKLGIDPLIDNPSDPWKRPLNYPRIWQYLSIFNINSNHTIAIGIFLIFLFFINVVIIYKKPNTKLIIIILLLLLSPTILLALERGNIDIIMLFLITLSVIFINRNKFISVFFILTAFILKLFPIFGSALILKFKEKKFKNYLLIIFLFSLAYTILTFSELKIIKLSTPEDWYNSYGMKVFITYLKQTNITVFQKTYFIPYILVTVILIISVITLIKKRGLLFPEVILEDMNLDFFRVGASIFLGIFILGNNYSYRLIFLILLIPQLYIWTEEKKSVLSKVSKLTIFLILVCLWFIYIEKYLVQLNSDWLLILIIKDIFIWSLFGLLILLFIHTLPEWFKNKVFKQKDI